MDIGDLTVLDGTWSSDRPYVILDAEFASALIDARELEAAVLEALRAMELSGKAICVLSGGPR